MNASPSVTTATTAPARMPSTGARVGILVTAVAVAIALNLVVAAIATAAGTPAGYDPLSVPALVIFTAVPMVVGWFGWRFVARRARRPERTLTLLVVAVFLLSLIPDVVLLATGFVPGTNAAAVVGLMATHIVVMGVAVVAYVAASRR